MNSYRSSPFANIPPVVKNLLIINIIFFIATLLFENSPLVQWFAVFYFDSPFFKVWQLVTYMFMHGGWAHIFFNMFALFTFGTALEYLMGSKRFLNFYLITGLGALVLQEAVQAIELYSLTGHIALNLNSFQFTSQEQLNTVREIYTSPMLGASGAIFGLLIAFGMLFPNAELFLLFFPFPVKAKYLIPIYVVIELFLGVARFSGDSIAHFAHLGGALFGFILIKIWKIRRPGGFI
ncbi:rhomboid family intramembrane serine protease [Rubrolithibacter danxiaensis]|uniref:rhomboid family intramembrane serine protease n=1 Tax=Rubrolithibacter danxiaensis TaxID=3390805 RepID=UPI003BF91A66